MIYLLLYFLSVMHEPMTMANLLFFLAGRGVGCSFACLLGRFRIKIWMQKFSDQVSAGKQMGPYSLLVRLTCITVAFQFVFFTTRKIELLFFSHNEKLVSRDFGE